MRKETVDAIMEASEVIGLDLERQDDYSGRGMYGESTWAVVGDFTQFVQCVAQAAAELARERESCNDAPLEEFIMDLGEIHSDSMGRSSQVWY